MAPKVVEFSFMFYPREIALVVAIIALTAVICFIAGVFITSGTSEPFKLIWPWTNRTAL